PADPMAGRVTLTGEIQRIDKLGLRGQLGGLGPGAKVHAGLFGEALVDRFAEKWEKRRPHTAERLENRVQGVVGVLFVIGRGALCAGPGRGGGVEGAPEAVAASAHVPVRERVQKRRDVTAGSRQV